MKLRCIYTGEEATGDWILADDYDIEYFKDECPICGASKDQQCNFINQSGKCEEIGKYIHSERILDND